MALSKDTLRETDNFLSSLTTKSKKYSPTDLDSTYYLLALEFGLTLDKLQDLPIPYIMSLINTHTYFKKEEEKLAKKARRKK